MLVTTAGTYRAGLAQAPSPQAPPEQLPGAGATQHSFLAWLVINWICSSWSDTEGSSWAMTTANSAPDNLHICKHMPQHPVDSIEIPTLFINPPLLSPAPIWFGWCVGVVDPLCRMGASVCPSVVKMLTCWLRVCIQGLWILLFFLIYCSLFPE